MSRFVFNTQKRELDHLLARTPEERNGITWALRLNHQALGFAAERRNLEAQLQFMFVQTVVAALRNGRYEADYGVFWRSSDRRR